MPGFRPSGKGGGKGRKSTEGIWRTIGGRKVEFDAKGNVISGHLPPGVHLKGGGKGGGKAKPPDHERAKDEKKSQRDYRKAGEAHAKAKAEHGAAKKALADHDKAAKGGPAKAAGLQAKHQAGAAKISEHKAAIAKHDERIAELKAKLKPAKAKATAKADKPAGKPDAAPAANSDAARKGSIAWQKSVHANRRGAPSREPDLVATPTPVTTAKTSAPRNARESAVLADAKARGKVAVVVTSTPQYKAQKSGGTIQHTVGGKTVASHHVNAAGKHVTTLYHRDGTRTTTTHATKESAKKHLEAYVKHRIAKGTTKYAVVGGDFSQFDHRQHGIGGDGHKVTARILGDGKARVGMKSARRDGVPGSAFRPKH